MPNRTSLWGGFCVDCSVGELLSFRQGLPFPFVRATRTRTTPREWTFDMAFNLAKENNISRSWNVVLNPDSAYLMDFTE